MHQVASYMRKRGYLSEMALTNSKSQDKGDGQVTRTGSGLNRTQDGNNYMCIHDPRGPSSPLGAITDGGVRDEGWPREINEANAPRAMRAITM